MGLGVLACGAARRAGDNVKGAASRELDCPEDSVTITDLDPAQTRLVELAGGPTQAYARGCGAHLVLAHMCQQGGAKCDWYAVKKLRIETLLERVAFDAKCPKNEIGTKQVGPNVVGVEACGQQATYLWSCPHNEDLFSRSCHWVLNTDSRPATPNASTSQ